MFTIFTFLILIAFCFALGGIAFGFPERKSGIYTGFAVILALFGMILSMFLLIQLNADGGIITQSTCVVSGTTCNYVNQTEPITYWIYLPLISLLFNALMIPIKAVL